jgi:hypothetical protein
MGMQQYLQLEEQDYCVLPIAWELAYQEMSTGRCKWNKGIMRNPPRNSLDVAEYFARMAEISGDFAVSNTIRRQCRVIQAMEAAAFSYTFREYGPFAAKPDQPPRRRRVEDYLADIYEEADDILGDQSIWPCGRRSRPWTAAYPIPTPEPPDPEQQAARISRIVADFDDPSQTASASSDSSSSAVPSAASGSSSSSGATPAAASSMSSSSPSSAGASVPAPVSVPLVSAAASLASDEDSDTPEPNVHGQDLRPADQIFYPVNSPSEPRPFPNAADISRIILLQETWRMNAFPH